MNAFTCRRCGRCCRQIGIPWSELDPHLAAAHLRMPLRDFLDKYGFKVNRQTGAIEHPELSVTPCPFLSYQKDQAICIIYPARPWICQGYPGPGMVCADGRRR